jgi:hypothetical protein
MCPFCGDVLEMGTVWVSNKSKAVVAAFKGCLSPTSCPTCQIAFTWDFDKNTVKMEKMGGGKEKSKAFGPEIRGLEKAIESIKGVEHCTIEPHSRYEIEAKIKTRFISSGKANIERARVIAETINNHLPEHIGCFGEAQYILDSGHKVRWTWT